MGHYIRILTPSQTVPSIARIRAALSSNAPLGQLEVEAGPDEGWTQISVVHESGEVVADIERNSDSDGDLIAEEIEEFREEIEDYEPASAAAWLADYLPNIKTIYAFQLLGGTEADQGWEILGTVKNSIHEQVGGIIQADHEGFTEERGFQILWQFSDSVTGPWWMAVLQDGKWIRFQMDLGNRKHRKAFLVGKVPDGVTMGE
ncbi:MAG TPA: hypothetical protein DDY91_18720 [Planctomycetaceae bacterium]|nr:hypothetical protein [Planctomycetaceae bacterium]